MDADDVLEIDQDVRDSGFHERSYNMWQESKDLPHTQPQIVGAELALEMGRRDT